MFQEYKYKVLWCFPGMYLNPRLLKQQQDDVQAKPTMASSLEERPGTALNLA